MAFGKVIFNSLVVLLLIYTPAELIIFIGRSSALALLFIISRIVSPIIDPTIP